MKKFFLLCLFFIAIDQASFAQGTFSNTGSGLNDLNKYMDEADSLGDEEEYEAEETEEKAFDKNDPLRDLAMEANDSSASFENFPEKNGVTAHVTNSDGELLLEKTLSERKREIDIHKLPKGLFFVTVTYRSHRKAFPLDRSDTEEKTKKTSTEQTD